MTSWIMPANPNAYKFEQAFSDNKYIHWHQCRNKYAVGDIIYIYESKPHQFIQFKCLVEAIDLPNVIENEDQYWHDIALKKKVLEDTKYMRISILHTLEQGISFEELKANGLKSAPQGAMKPQDGLKQYIESCFG